MPPSPSPAKRPSLAERSSSTHSLSSSGKQATQQKAHRVTRHSRNFSHGKGLAKLGKINSTANMAADGRNHSRKKSGPVTPGHSPRTPVSPHMKRNSSQVMLPKNLSHGNLRKNQSAVALASARTSSTNLKKLGAPPSQKEQGEHKQGFFELGDQSSGEDDEGEWEDSTTQSPELSRNHSKASTPLRPRTPNGDSPQRLATKVQADRDQLTSPPESDLKTANRSLPNLRKVVLSPFDQKSRDPAFIHNQPRVSRAPPAMSTISAHVQVNETVRPSSRTPSQDPNAATGNVTGVTSVGMNSSSGSQGVSHFLQSSSAATSHRSTKVESDDEDAAEFMANYKPQVVEPSEDVKGHNKARVTSVPSRTQQRLELQRREMLRAGATAPATPTTPALGLSAGSSVSLHSRSGSKGRIRSLAGDPKALQLDYETGIRQLTVVRRFRNPVVESLQRLRESGAVPSDVSSALSSSVSKSRPQSRRGPLSAVGTPKVAFSRSPEDKKSTPQLSGGTSQSRGTRVQFQISRQGSHDDILNAQGSPGDSDEEQDGITPDEALIRRIWESQVMYDSEGVHPSGTQMYPHRASQTYVQQGA